MDGNWLSVLEYASYKNKSISTVRRYIKANRVKYKEENGKYFIWTKNFFNQVNTPKEERELTKLRFELSRVNSELQKLKEENQELKMLISLLEKENESKNINLPKLPELPIEN